MPLFDNYYSGFLGLDSRTSVSKCKRRSETFSFYWKILVITTDYWKDLKTSVSPELYEEFVRNNPIINLTRINVKLTHALDDWFCRHSWNYQINQYLRYCITSLNEESSISAEARALTLKDKELVLQNHKKRSKGYQNAVWNNYFLPLVEKGHYFILEKDDKRAAYAVITDIDNGGANIMVATDPAYQKRGYGKAVVAKAVKWCFENDLIPCYFHQDTNIASQRLAESLGFQLQNRECDIFIHKNEKYIKRSL